MINTIVQNSTVSSPLDISGCFDKKKHLVAGAQMTLNDLENKKLRPDPRVHFCLVCGAKGCPKLSSKAFMPATVQEQMRTATEKALNDPLFVRVDYGNKVVNTSQIFEWYKDDFISASGNIITFINTYRSTKIPGDARIEYYPYDWSLNGK